MAQTGGGTHQIRMARVKARFYFRCFWRPICDSRLWTGSKSRPTVPPFEKKRTVGLSIFSTTSDDEYDQWHTAWMPITFLEILFHMNIVGLYMTLTNEIIWRTICTYIGMDSNRMIFFWKNLSLSFSLWIWRDWGRSWCSRRAIHWTQLMGTGTSSSTWDLSICCFRARRTASTDTHFRCIETISSDAHCITLSGTWRQ